MAARIKKKKLLYLIIILMGLAPALGQQLASAYKAIDAADDNDANWSEPLKNLAIVIEGDENTTGVYQDVLDNELTTGELASAGSAIQDALDLL